ncbi:MAG: hypothetical protein P1P88_22980, partial [Bacteroidales bacterium]|nr:hypothetical protein [Bacteroidales bacterium]
IEKKEADFYDYINLGHTFWCKGDIVSATSAYKQSIEIARKKGETIKKDFLDDKDFLVKHGIHAFEIELMLDYLLLDDIGYEKMTF